MASFYMIFSDEDDEEFGDKNNPMAANDDDTEGNVKYSKNYNADDDERSDSKSDSDNQSNWEVLMAKLITAYKVINQQNRVIGKLGFAILISDKSQLKMILYKSKIDILSIFYLRESNKIYVKGNFIQYLDSSNNFWSVLFENEKDRDEAIRLLEERCTIEREELEVSINSKDVKGDDEHENESEKRENVGTGDGDATCDKACETDPEEKANKQLKANILTRMAKMGKRLVPSSNKNSDVSDSSDPESSPKRQPQKPNTPHSSPILQVAKLQPAPTAHSTANTVEFRHNHHSNIISAASSDSSLNLMMMQNTEIRFNLSKLDSKLDRLYDKLEVLSTTSSVSNDRNNNDSLREEDIVRLEEKLVAIKRENLSLKSIIRDLEDKVKTHSNADELNELKVQIIALQQENKNISLDVKNKEEQVRVLEAKLKESTEACEEREVLMRTNMADVGELKSQLNIASRRAQDLQIAVDGIHKQRESAVTREIQTEGRDNVPSEVLIKEIMNSLYLRICDKISNLNELKHSEVLKIIGQTIKQETSECLRKNTSQV